MAPPIGFDETRCLEPFFKAILRTTKNEDMIQFQYRSS
ncbi:hypothetical protein ABI_43250 [Asticcacaulis biprosthecium C19]|uniref:Uncharacterized protein n=1 Tax=Asticcacaulis biprosthecium C19 TaxID=715226 RepID=F4QT32_9CAUL|nr:hypothetical protein ABI_43250 [Asticcacaulis biprosthecium C19]